MASQNIHLVACMYNPEPTAEKTNLLSAEGEDGGGRRVVGKSRWRKALKLSLAL